LFNKPCSQIDSLRIKPCTAVIKTKATTNNDETRIMNNLFTVKSFGCYNESNITATPIEEAQPWRFFIAQNKWGQHV